ncbi:MAG: hypothetical protein COB78_06750 [Hyphomicrobiales bacterium]|nr:MAG: hypothetical protein COB78_06750 [Hyphomicrobiales bacterium]
MPTLYEMMQNAQSGEFHQNLSRQFELTQEQTEKALEALLPAFSQGLKRNTADPAGFASFMQALSSGQHSQYMNNPAAAFSPAGMQDGNAILSHLFGNKDVSRAVAAQAAQASGIGESILKQMLPALAPMVLGGLFKQMQGGGSTASNLGGSQNPWGQILEQMMGGGPAQSGNRPQSRNPLEDLLGQMMGGGARQAPSQPSPMDNPLGKIFEDMLSGGAGNRRTQSRPQNEQKIQPEESSGGGLGDLFGEMFDTGRQTQEKYQSELGSIFDQFLKGKR